MLSFYTNSASYRERNIRNTVKTPNIILFVFLFILQEYDGPIEHVREVAHEFIIIINVNYQRNTNSLNS